MADKRKLQCDIDRTLKRVQEGRVSFQEILDKFESSTNQAQKEKFEADLKKEIKRLQRFRDQIKTWLTSNDIKDKRPLLEARKMIEQDMERFKVIEKETKTKAYSKEGLLTADAKKDPLQKEKEELDDWLKQSISSLQTISEKYEYELETLTNTGKKKRADKEKAALIEEKRQKLDLCAYHIEKLETVMRLLDNQRLDSSKVRSLHDPIEYVIESIDEKDMEEYRTLYEDMHLEDLGDATLMTPSTPAAVGFQDYDSTNVPSAFPALSKNGNGGDEPSASIPTTVIPAGSSTSSNASSSSRERQPKHLLEEKSAINPISASSTSTPVKDKRGEKGSKGQPSSNLANQTAPSSFHLVNSSIAAPSPHKKSFAGAASKQQNEAAKAETEKSSPVVNEGAQTPRENYAKVAGESKKDKSKKEHQQDAESKSVTPTPASGSKSEKRKGEKESKERTPSVDPSATKPSTPSIPTDSAPVASTPVTTATPSNVSASTFSVSTPASNLDSNMASTIAQQQQQQAAVMAAVAQQQQQQQAQQQQNQLPFVIVHPRDALAPFRNRQREFPPELRSQFHALDSAARKAPLPCDTEKSRMLVFKRQANVPQYFPSEPVKGSDTEEYYSKLDAQTLFFLFYFFEGTKAQYLAAKALKRMSWRFHTKYMMWFQRNEEPKQITDEFESGTYIYYDFQTMSQRKKEEFIFHYSFLEDKDF